MKFDQEKHHRHSLRLKGFDYSSTGAYFITICIHNRQCILTKINEGMTNLSKTGFIADKYWRLIPKHFQNISLGEFCIMPNHIHSILIIQKNVGVEYNNVGVEYELSLNHIQPLPTSNRENPTNRFQHIAPSSIGSIIRTYKTAVTKWCRNHGQYEFAWQRNYYEHIIRSDVELRQISEYIRDNPLNWADDPEYFNQSP